MTTTASLHANQMLPTKKGTPPDVPAINNFKKRLLGKNRSLDKGFNRGLENFKSAFSHPVLRIKCRIYFSDLPGTYLWTFCKLHVQDLRFINGQSVWYRSSCSTRDP